MSRLPRLLAALAVSLPLVVFTGWESADGAAPLVEAGPGLHVELDRSSLDAGPGEKFSFASTIRNTGEAAENDLVAHLNILTTDADVYVDPEDWSPERTQYLDELPPGESVELTWSVQAVTSGPLILYVSVTSPKSERVSSSGPLNLTVRGQRVVDSGGVLPLVLWMPGGVLALFTATLLRRRRHR